MQELPDGLNRLSPSLRTPLRQYAERLKQLGGGRLLALIVFGDAASDAFVRERGVIQSAVVLDAIELDTLRAIGMEGRRLGKEHIAAPLIFTPAFLQQSCDTFPLELIEIQQRHEVVLGADHFSPLKFRDAHIRLQCERELKVISVGMHQGLLTSAGNGKHLAMLSGQWTEHLLRTLRGILWLTGAREGRAAEEVVGKAEELFGRALPGARAMMERADHGAWDRYRQLYADVQGLEQFVNAM